MTDKNLRQVPVRFHEEDYIILKKLLLDDRLSFQKFMTCCLEMYKARNSDFMRLLKGYVEYIRVPRDIREGKKLEHKDQDELYKAIERAQQEVDEVDGK